MRGLVFPVILISGLFFSDADVNAFEGIIPFQPGEKLEFQIKWSFIPAGISILEVLPIEKIDGEDILHFVLTVRTNDYVDMIYKVRDRIDSYASADMSRAVLYKKQRTGRTKKEETVTFDWNTNEAQYSNFGEKKDPISILPGTFDLLSVFYYFRLHELDKVIEINVPVTDGKKCIIGVARVSNREIIEVAGRSYDTFLVEPGLEDLGGMFKKSSNPSLRIWVTADARRIPVRIESSLMAGTFVAELVSFVNGFSD